MSILIRGMRMPENCGMCSMAHRNFDGHETRLACYAVCDWADDSGEGRLHNCPLVELPANHGSLIDREATISALSENAYAVGKSALPMMMTLVKAINDVKRMPVIVEAEGVDENDKP